MNLAGIILCGGQSRRMGRPKAWLDFGGETLLGRTIRVVQEAAWPIVVVAAPQQEVPPLPSGVILVRDEEQGRGPLQGLAAGLASLPENAGPAFVASCDLPFLRAPLILRLKELLEDNQICVPQVEGRLHPLTALYQREVLPVVRKLLAENRLRPVFLFQEVPTRIVTEEDLQSSDPGFQSFHNVNTPEEYEQALKTWNKQEERRSSVG